MPQYIRYPANTYWEMYNTGSVATNYERAQAFWSGDVFYLRADAGGTGTKRVLQLAAFGGGLACNPFASANGSLQLKADTSTAGVGIAGVTGTLSATTNSQFALKIAPTFTQTATAGYTALLVNVTETTTGTGTKRLVDAQVGAASKFWVDNTGATFLANTAAEPATPTGGGVLFVSAGALKYKGSSGTVTTLGPA